jgi:hypothetical protein
VEAFKDAVEKLLIDNISLTNAGPEPIDPAVLRARGRG